MNSCSKDIDIVKEYDNNIVKDKSYLLKLPLNKQVDYANTHLLRLGKVFDKLWKQPNFKRIIIDKMRKKVKAGFDAEVLFEDIIYILQKSTNISYTQEDVINIQKEIEAFQGILKDEKLKPQIAIPFFDKKYNKLVVSRSTSETKYVLTTEPHEPDEVKVYISNNGQLQELPDKISEQDAILIDDLVALGLNEFDPADEFDYNPIIIQDTLTVDPVNTSSGQQNVLATYDLYISRMQINKHKEPWYKGGSEIHYTVKGITGNKGGGVYYYNGILLNENLQEPFNVVGSSSEGAGHTFAFWSRRDVRRGVIKQRNKLIALNFASAYTHTNSMYDIYPYTEGISKDYLNVQVMVFEYDTWPAGVYVTRLVQPANSIVHSTSVSLPIHGSYERGDDNYSFVHGRTWNDYYASYVVFNIPFTQFNEINPGLYNCSDTDEVIQTRPFYRDGLPYIKHISVLHH